MSLLASHTLEIAVEGEAVTVFIAPDKPTAAKLVREEKVEPGRVLLLEDLQWLKANCSSEDARKLLTTKLQFNAGRIQAAKEAKPPVVRTVDVPMTPEDVQRVALWVGSLRALKRSEGVERKARTSGRSEAEDVADDEGGKLVELAWARFRGYEDQVDWSIEKGPDAGHDFRDPDHGRVACKGMQAEKPGGLEHQMFLTFGPARTFHGDIAVFGKVAHDRSFVRLCGWIERARYNPVAVKGWGRYGDNKPVGMPEGALNPMSSVKPRGPA